LILRGLGRDLGKVGGGRKRKDSGQVPPGDDPHGSGGPDEAAAFIAATSAELSHIAKRHGLRVLGRLLDMAQLEADEWLRRRRRLS
jgi:hypothetical protein